MSKLVLEFLRYIGQVRYLRTLIQELECRVQLQEVRMSKLDEAVARLEQDLVNVKRVIAELKQVIEDIKNDGASPETLARLDFLDAQLDVLAPDPVVPLPSPTDDTVTSKKK